MKLSSCLPLFVVALATASAFTSADHIPTFSTKILVDSATQLCSVIKPTAPAQLHRAIKSPRDVVEQSVGRQNRVSKEEILILQDEPDAQKLIEIIGGSAAAVDFRVLERCPKGITSSPAGATKRTALRLATADVPMIKKIVDSGNPSNRIDVVFMGDGYTLSEESKFFDDIQRLTDEMFTGDTFAQYLPLFNVWAAFLPSNESGIGVGGEPKDTAFGLYRGRFNCILYTRILVSNLHPV